jgi:hypothetical protein
MIKSIRGRACNTHGREEECIEDLDGKTEGKRPPGRPRRRLEDNVKLHLREIVWSGMDCIHLG